MTARQRLDAIQEKLVAQGVTDIKFFWARNSEKPLSQVCSDVADVLEATLNGNCKSAVPFGDSQRAL